ncbi:sensor domain-containing diguanylate cyclase [Ideonella sp. YS5]|uniref:sensor domain-containing diguanylate cyclase n=1 Tax=Ideonella sp. YS5 TaxID=3453714 RepID=UPI003EECDDA0
MPDQASRSVPVLLSNAVPTAAEQRLALAVVLLSTLAFAAAAPYAKTPLAPQPVFVAVYQSALAINDALTAVLLLGLFGLMRTRALLLLGGAYLFTGLVALVHALSFPGLFAANGLLGAGTQTTAWLYMLWHGAFPTAVIGYVLLGQDRAGLAWRTDVVVALTAAAAALLVAAFTLLTTAGERWLPAIMDGHHYTPSMLTVVTMVWSTSAVAAATMWRHRGRSVLDLWLFVSMCAWVFDIGLSAVFNAGRFDLGFYAGRLYGLLASCLVLVTLLTQTLRLYGQLAAANDTLRDLAERDGLTGLFNRRHFDLALRSELLRNAREQRPLSLLLVDVDHFKHFNDTHGHLAGDTCLCTVARCVGRCVGRPADLAARFGGEEFAVLLPCTDAPGALRVAEQVRTAVAANAAQNGTPVTVSIGAVTLWPHPGTQPDEAIAAADSALYEAKAAGRNRVARRLSADAGLNTLAA